MRRLFLAFFSLVLLAFSSPTHVPAQEAPLSASPTYSWQFPEDHGEHREYASEWWYTTGHLHTPDKKHRFGYEATLFRSATPLTDAVSPETSAWISPQVYLVHVALTDITGQKFYYASSYERDNPYRPVVSVHPWRMRTKALEVKQRRTLRLGDPVWDLDVYHDDYALHLRLLPRKKLVYHGTENGYSKKGDCTSCASMYTSYTQLYTAGEVVFPNPENPRKPTVHKVVGRSWFDHEFGSSQLTEKQVGWDWFAIQLENGRELMVYRMRERDGKISPQSGGTLVLKTGDTIYLKRDDIQVKTLARWTSKRSGATYPAKWQVEVPKANLNITVTPEMVNQELYFAEQPELSYWEGAARVEGKQGGKPVNGSAYVELAGYVGKLKF